MVFVFNLLNVIFEMYVGAGMSYVLKVPVALTSTCLSEKKLLFSYFGI